MKAASSKSRVKPTMLFTRKADVESINARHLGKLEGERHTFTVSTVSSGPHIPLAELQKAVAATDANATYAGSLVLVKEAQVMLLVNTYSSLGLVNGSRGVVTGFETSDDGVVLPVVEFRNGARIRIEYATWTVPIHEDMYLTKTKPSVMRKQIPLRLAYAITIHKAQGATLDCALIDVGDTTFEYGQAYVALSRLKDLEGLFIHDIDVRAFRAHPKVVQFYASA
jgi:ATP-dependent DNA helicase PIF1